MKFAASIKEKKCFLWLDGFLKKQRQVHFSDLSHAAHASKEEISEQDEAQCS